MSENRLVIVDNLAKKFEFGRGAPKPKLGDWEGIESDLTNLLEAANLDIGVESFPSETPTAATF